MFDIGWSELVVIGVVALIAIGPKELPGVLRTVGQYMGKIRRMAAEFQGQFQEAMREAEMADLKKQVDDMTDAAKGITDFDPIADVRKEVESFASDPLGSASSTAGTEPATTESAASASPEAAPADTPAPISSDAVVSPTDATVGAGAPQAGAETKPGGGA
jgi:sec-independent protein translocase protein TatB